MCVLSDILGLELDFEEMWRGGGCVGYKFIVNWDVVDFGYL